MSLLADDEVGNIIMRAGGGDLELNRTAGNGNSLMTSFNQDQVGNYPSNISPPFTKHMCLFMYTQPVMYNLFLCKKNQFVNCSFGT